MRQAPEVPENTSPAKSTTAQESNLISSRRTILSRPEAMLLDELACVALVLPHRHLSPRFRRLLCGDGNGRLFERRLWEGLKADGEVFDLGKLAPGPVLAAMVAGIESLMSMYPDDWDFVEQVMHRPIRGSLPATVALVQKLRSTLPRETFHARRKTFRRWRGPGLRGIDVAERRGRR